MVDTTAHRAASCGGPAVSWPDGWKRFAPWPLALGLAALLPFAAAHDAPAGPYDPLSLEWHAFLAADGTIGASPPAAGAVPFPASPSPPTSASAPLRFTFAAPVTFEPGGGFVVRLALRVDKPLVAQDEALELVVMPGGDAVRVSLPGGPVLAPGTVVTVEQTLHAPGARYERGDALGLVLQPLLPALPEDALSVVTGPESGSLFDAIDMRVPSPAHLRLQDLPHTEIVLGVDQFAPPSSHAVNVFSVGHDAVVPPAAGAWSDAGTYVLLRGEEPEDVAREHALVDEDTRRAAAHAFRVNGLPARVHPGLGVIVRITLLPIRVVCEENCPAGGSSWSYAPLSTAPTAESPGVLVPPPRDTSAVPVSRDEPPARGTPFSGPLVVLALALTLALGLPKR